MCSKSRDSELVIGLVAPVGVDLDPVQNYISEYMKIIGYDENIIRLSRIIKEFPGIKTPIIEDNEYNRIDSLMSAGTEMREKAEIGEILSVLAALDIFESRGENNEPLGKIVHLIRSLKHPAEVMVFRKVYSHGFFLLGVSSSHSNRLNNLENDKDMTNEQAKSLMERDEDETKLLGQRTRDVFHLADGFIDIDKIEEVKEQIYRILDLIFGDPHMTPDPDEYAMNLAFSSALRSADLSRQVGAVIMSSNKEIISLGCNDVPASGGGLYWSNDNKPHRDVDEGFNANDRRKIKLIKKIMDVFKDKTIDEINKKQCSSENDEQKDNYNKLRELIKEMIPDNQEELIDKGTEWLEETGVSDITEYARSVHAEMEALMSCTRTGVSTRNCTLYCTTFPCHNCAKHYSCIRNKEGCIC